MPPPGGMPGLGGVSFLGFSATIVSVGTSNPAIDAASCSAVQTTFVGEGSRTSAQANVVRLARIVGPHGRARISAGLVQSGARPRIAERHHQKFMRLLFWTIYRKASRCGAGNATLTGVPIRYLFY